MTRSFKYVGPFDEVEVPALGVTVKHGETVQVDDPDVSAGLDGQDTWEPVKAAKKTESKEG